MGSWGGAGLENLPWIPGYAIGKHGVLQLSYIVGNELLLPFFVLDLYT